MQKGDKYVVFDQGGKIKYFDFVWFGLVWFMVSNATFNNISVISCHSVLLVEETGVPGKNHQPATSNWQTLSHNVVSSTPHLSRVRTHYANGNRQLIALVIVNPTTIWSRSWWPLVVFYQGCKIVFWLTANWNIFSSEVWMIGTCYKLCMSCAIQTVLMSLYLQKTHSHHGHYYSYDGHFSGGTTDITVEIFFR